jgi:hypothetical protein
MGAMVNGTPACSITTNTVAQARNDSNPGRREASGNENVRTESIVRSLEEWAAAGDEIGRQDAEMEMHRRELAACIARIHQPSIG